MVASFSPGGFTQTVSDSLAMATKDTTSTVYGFFQTYSDSLAMAAKDLVKSVYGWSNTLKSAIENWVNRPKS